MSTLSTYSFLMSIGAYIFWSMAGIFCLMALFYIIVLLFSVSDKNGKHEFTRKNPIYWTRFIRFFPHACLNYINDVYDIISISAWNLVIIEADRQATETVNICRAFWGFFGGLLLFVLLVCAWLILGLIVLFLTVGYAIIYPFLFLWRKFSEYYNQKIAEKKQKKWESEACIIYGDDSPELIKSKIIAYVPKMSLRERDILKYFLELFDKQYKRRVPDDKRVQLGVNLSEYNTWNRLCIYCGVGTTIRMQSACFYKPGDSFAEKMLLNMYNKITSVSQDVIDYLVAFEADVDKKSQSSVSLKSRVEVLLHTFYYRYMCPVFNFKRD